MDERAEAGLSQDNAAVITGEYSVVDDERQHLSPISDSEREEAREYIIAILNSPDPSAEDAKRCSSALKMRLTPWLKSSVMNITKIHDDA